MATALHSALAPKKSSLVLLRWVLVISASYLILFHNSNADTSRAAVLLLFVSNIVVSLLPERVFYHRLFDPLLVLGDVVLVTAVLWWTKVGESELFLAYFIILMTATLSSDMMTLFLGCLIVVLSYLCFIALQRGPYILTQIEVLVRIPFFFIVAYLYGTLAQRIRTSRKQTDALQAQLEQARRVRKCTTAVATGLERGTILRTCVNVLRDFLDAPYVCIISRAEAKVLVESGSAKVRTGGQWSQTLEELTQAIARNATRQRNREVLGRAPEHVESLRVQDMSFLPVNSDFGGDLYVGIWGDIQPQVCDYVILLLESASNALENAGRYQSLIHEVEGRQQIVRQYSEALEFQNQFIANVSHELRTPLYSLLGYCELLEDGGYGEVRPEQVAVLNRMAENAHQLLQLVNNILDLSKMRAGAMCVQRTPGILSQFLDDVYENALPLLRAKSLVLQFSRSDSLPALVLDWSMLRHVVMNLVSNAIKFTERGRIGVSAQFDATQRQLEIVVEDTGAGIAADKLSEIFQPFRQLDNAYTKKFAGTGLGLALCKQQVEMMGGQISVESEVGAGSRFVVRLPADSLNASEAAARHANAEAIDATSRQPASQNS